MLVSAEPRQRGRGGEEGRRGQGVEQPRFAVGGVEVHWQDEALLRGRCEEAAAAGRPG